MREKPTKACLNLAMKVVDQLYDSDQYERCIFYIDIVLDLLDRNNDEISAIKYLKMESKFTSKQLVVT